MYMRKQNFAIYEGFHINNTETITTSTRNIEYNTVYINV